MVHKTDWCHIFSSQLNPRVCLRLTEEQYSILHVLAGMPRFRCLFEAAKSQAKKHSSLPSWQELVTGTGSHFCLVAFSGWLSLLRLGLISTGANGAEELYAQILAAYEGAVNVDLSKAESKSTAMYSSNYPHSSFRLKLHIAHTGGEWFEAHLERLGFWTYLKTKRSNSGEARRGLHHLQVDPCRAPSIGPRQNAALIFDELAKHLPAGAQGTL